MWTLDRDDSVPLWRAADRGGPTLAFTTRRGGRSAPPYDTLNLGRSTDDDPDAVEANRRAVLESLDLASDRLATAGQVHGARVAHVTGPGLHRETDALLTRTPGLALAVTAADCVPILITAPGTVCAVHAGWRGAADALPLRSARAVMDAGAHAATELTAHVGPSIRGCCYVVGPEVAERFPASTRRATDTGWALDLAAAAHLQLSEAGIPDERIHVIAACTACEPYWYFSHRRDAGRTGRHWAVAAV